MKIVMATVFFHDEPLPAVLMDGKEWLGADQFFALLGYSHPKKVKRFYDREKEHLDGESRLFQIAAGGVVQTKRLFSVKMVENMAMWVQTDACRKIRRELLDALSQEQCGQILEEICGIPASLFGHLPRQ